MGFTPARAARVSSRGRSEKNLSTTAEKIRIVLSTNGKETGVNTAAIRNVSPRECDGKPSKTSGTEAEEEAGKEQVSII